MNGISTIGIGRMFRTKQSSTVVSKVAFFTDIIAFQFPRTTFSVNFTVVVDFRSQKGEAQWTGLSLSKQLVRAPERCS